MEYAYSDVKDFIDKNYNFYLELKSKQEFNIFTAISNRRYHENFHSATLATLFKNKVILNDFLELIGIKVDNYENAQIQTEYTIKDNRRIDILITGNSHAIIIENKMNWADDLPNQIYDYYTDIKEKEYEVDKIVYLTADGHEPSKNSLGYDIDEKEDEKKEEYIKAINDENRLILLTGFDGNDNDLVSCLEKSLSTLTKDNEEKNSDKESYRVFLNNYINLLKNIGGYMSKMANSFLDEIKNSSDKSIIDKLAYIQDVLNIALPQLRIDNLCQIIKGGEARYGYKNWFKDYDSNAMWAFLDSIKETKIVLTFKKEVDREGVESFLKENELELEKWKITDKTGPYWNHKTICEQKFQFPSEDEKVIEIMTKLDKILS